MNRAAAAMSAASAVAPGLFRVLTPGLDLKAFVELRSRDTSSFAVDRRAEYCASPGIQGNPRESNGGSQEEY
jgi:hypothetical protein